MPEIGVGREYPLCPEGVDVFRLKEVEAKDMPKFDGSGTNERLIWKFISRQRDPASGEFYEVSLFTPSYYTGHPKSKLTWLMRQIDKRVSKEWIKSNKLNTDHYADRDYEGLVQHTLSEDGSKTYAVFAYLKPLVNAASPAAADTKHDPFVDGNAGAVEGCEVCGQELTVAEINACQTRWPNQHLFCAQHGREKIALEKIEALETEDLFAAA